MGSLRMQLSSCVATNGQSWHILLALLETLLLLLMLPIELLRRRHELHVNTGRFGQGVQRLQRED